MTLIELIPIGEDRCFPADKSKIQKRELTPKSLEISLLKSIFNTSIYISLVFDETILPGEIHPSIKKVETRINLRRMPEDEALKKYEEVSEKIKRGEYSLVHYDNGALEIQLH